MSMYCETAPTGVPGDVAARFAALVPVLRTARLTLRAPCADDFAVYADIACGPRGAGIGGPMSREEAWYDFASLASCWMLQGHGGWTVTRSDTGTVVGFAMIGAEPGDAEPELGYMIDAAHEGQGYATEAATAGRDHAFGALRLPSLVSYIFPGNAASIAVARRLGAIADGTLAYPGDAVASLVYRHAKPEDA